MSWVRYDDGFHDHAKVMEARDRDAGSIALHLLANTWSARTKRPGFVPSVLPRQLVGSKGKRWAEILVEAGLWHVVDGGWVFHDWEDYAAPGKYRTSPGTPEALSAKRAAAGRKGGKASGARRQAKQTGEQNEQHGSPATASGVVETEGLDQVTGTRDARTAPANSDADGGVLEGVVIPRTNGITPGHGLNGVATIAKQVGEQANQLAQASLQQSASNEASPVVGISKELTLLEIPTPEPEPVQPSAADDASARAAKRAEEREVNKRSQAHARYFRDLRPMSTFAAVMGIAKTGVEAGYEDDQIRDGLAQVAAEGRTLTTETLRIAIEGLPPREVPPKTDERKAMLQRSMDRARAKEASGQ